MTQGEFDVTVNAPIERVWPWVATLERHSEWSPRPYRMEWLSGEPNAVGSRYRSVGWVPGDKAHVNEGEVTERSEPGRFALRADDPQGAFENTFTLRPVDGGTHVTFRLVFPRMRVPIRWIAAVLFATTGSADIRKRMQLLKARVEASEG
jgi:uncharacterized protein YndB with AHSA1/START domain